jgi:predicted small lipoprotein YifL
MSLPFPPGRALLLAGMLVLALGACGRRGPPEAPLTSAEIAAQQNAQARQQRQAAAVEDDDPVGDGAVMTPVPTPTRRRSRAYTIPNDPFILDPLL